MIVDTEKHRGAQSSTEKIISVSLFWLKTLCVTLCNALVRDTGVHTYVMQEIGKNSIRSTVQ